MSGGIICVGNAALDRVYRVDVLPTGPTKMRAVEHIESGGGTAANAAVTIARLGGPVELWSRVGDDDIGRRIRAGLEAERVDVRYVASFEEVRSPTTVVIVDDSGERIIVGARDVQMPSSTSWLPLERVAGASVVLADLRWLEAVRTVFLHARKAAVPTVLDVDLGGREALPELLGLTDYAIFTEQALEDFMPGLEPRAALERAMLHGVRHAGVTRGRHGYEWRDSFGGGSLPAFPVDTVDTTGAGDAFHGAFTLALSEKRSVTDCVRFATATAALKCLRLGSRAGLPRRPDVDAFLSTHSDVHA